MTRRRTLLATAWLVVIVAAAASAQVPTPSAALDKLKVGNARYVKEAGGALPIDAEKRLAQTKGQSPYAIVVSCADSRVPPEVIFNAGLGEIFVVRTAGEVVDKAVLASVEYGAEHLHAPLLVVMGHESCGAVKTAVECKLAPKPASLGPNLDALVDAIRPSFERMSTPVDLDHLREAVLANVEQVVNDLLVKSATVKHLASRGELLVVGAYYELPTGRVRFSEPAKVPAEIEAKTPAAAHKDRP